ncbi:hypothetical protein C8F04DRAFT_1095244 [Mycena alexandri]|uniref:Uncharacterized protein n=1 Tax=Mycena alexandri TaxID=1745969 RepID=A0AAD6X937_9AGAR|nr:hypothetical protein C8F04DRAFT_1095244 [Mycena alexandri]
MTEKWHSTHLSTILPELSNSAQSLKGCLQARRVNVAQCIYNLDRMERCIYDLMSTFCASPSRTGDPNFSLDPEKLTEEARRTQWDTLPISAIANAHKEKADALTYRGNPDGTPAHLGEIYIEYVKYLLLHKLHPDITRSGHDPAYTQVFKNVSALEQHMIEAARFPS